MVGSALNYLLPGQLIKASLIFKNSDCGYFVCDTQLDLRV
jgi:hypothetical protein